MLFWWFFIIALAIAIYGVLCIICGISTSDRDMQTKGSLAIFCGVTALIILYEYGYLF